MGQIHPWCNSIVVNAYADLCVHALGENLDMSEQYFVIFNLLFSVISIVSVLVLEVNGSLFLTTC